MPEINPAHRLLSADFLTLSYRVVGKMMVPNNGMLGMMNDTTHSFMEVVDAKLAPIHMPTKLVGEYEIIDLVKHNVFAVCLDAAGKMRVPRHWRGVVIKIWLNIPSGSPPRSTSWKGFWNGPGDLILPRCWWRVPGISSPLYNATLTAILIPQLRIESPAILFNRRQVDLLAVITDKKQV